MKSPPLNPSVISGFRSWSEGSTEQVIYTCGRCWSGVQIPEDFIKQAGEPKCPHGTMTPHLRANCFITPIDDIEKYREFQSRFITTGAKPRWRGDDLVEEMRRRAEL